MSVNGITPFGKQLRNIRLRRQELLFDMAIKLGLKSSDLSAIENGRTSIPNGFVDLILSKYDLSEREIDFLREI